jgi:hypothetical protein
LYTLFRGDTDCRGNDIPGVPKVLRHVVFFKYLSRDQSYNLDSFFKRCVVKSSTKAIKRNSYWVVLMVSSIVKMNRSDEGPMSHGIKYFEANFISK